jgi:hypothetical protein
MLGHYILDGHQPVAVTDVLEWAHWYEEADRRVGLSFTEHFEISTVFLGLDHNFGGDGPPLLFETMVFRKHGKAYDLAMDRYSTWDEAERGHLEMVRLAIKMEGMTDDRNTDAESDPTG